ncbi:MAG: sulfur carrier protein ThiS [bacterium]|nr:sulfur carrier protein ThiS [bacterium]
MKNSICVNGENIEVRATNLDELVAELGLSGKQIALEQNGVIVPRSAYSATELAPGDKLEIVHCVAGG